MVRREQYHGGKKGRSEKKGCQAHETHCKKDGKKSRKESQAQEKRGQNESR